MKSSGLVFVVVVATVGVPAIGGHVFACGDKLVVVGRGLKANRLSAPRRASILVYADPKGALPAALEEGHLRKDLERAGHRLRTATSREEFDAALGTGTYDLVLADFKAAPLLEPAVQAAASKPTVLPTLFNPSDADLAAALRQYTCVVKSPSDQKNYMIVINEAMAERAKQTSPKSK
ncbi:MAG TPA: hypothetical protein VKI41_12960 [Vicinamibacteria bacterium]|nr:hypothetical protein [Vicinamibacteria bacterium]